MLDRSTLRFDATMSVKYHRRRAAFLGRVSSLMSAAILFSGAGAFASLFGEHSGNAVIAQGLSAFIALIGIVQVVFQTDRCAAEHQGWLRRWTELLKDIEQSESPTHAQLGQWNAERLNIEGECVGEMRALQEDCYNRTIASLNLDGEPRKLRLHHRIFMQLYSFENAFQ